MVWLAQLIASLASFFAEKLVKNTALIVASIAVFLTLTGLMAVAIKALLVGIVMNISDSRVLLGMSWMLPSNLPACISAYITARMTRWAYDIALFKLNYWKSLTGGY